MNSVIPLLDSGIQKDLKIMLWIPWSSHGMTKKIIGILHKCTNKAKKLGVGKVHIALDRNTGKMIF